LPAARRRAGRESCFRPARSARRSS
jgi:hypothetical protein